MFGTESDLRDPKHIMKFTPTPPILIYLQFEYLMYELKAKYFQFVIIRAESREYQI